MTLKECVVLFIKTYDKSIVASFEDLYLIETYFSLTSQALRIWNVGAKDTEVYIF